ncbi:hypothetical protein THAOC_13185 [Thalassiosira oceanica]|uniref:Uncharacterized protein n=1 Tax=Thalassiosira oceanica TaxID=159749 RepID=K0SI73_THAOC|nr:hypothetical protein THAOC_13185 [Thalassiosira oceanica]|eukprot:EJK65918.1 hypothetical protein THAOC_13185 [Thalassiosira oceanica]
MSPMQKDLRLKVIVLGSAGAGKTCLLRRYIHGTFEGTGSPYKTGKKRTTTSTLGADYYVKKVANPLKQRSNSVASSAVKSDAQILVQLWDTAGKERLKPQSHPSQYDAKSSFFQFLSIKPSKRNLLNNKWHRYNNWGNLDDYNLISSLDDDVDEQDLGPNHLGPSLDEPFRSHSRGDALFRHIDACMFVYDATSSMSFLHLMQWHSEWMAKIKHWEEEACKGRNDSHKQRRNIPFIVVATKIDLLEQQNMRPRNRNARSIMGFDRYAGQDHLYEYAAEATKDDIQCTLEESSCRISDNPNHVGRLTYSLNETLWSRDAAYLDTLARIDDDLPANRQMIMVWCQRNGIPHVEASALDGRGVDEAMELLIQSSAKENMTRGHREMSSAAAPAQENNTHHEPEDEHIRDATQFEKINDHGSHTSDGDEAAGLSDTSQLGSSQYYFVYEPRSSGSGDLFERYQSRDEKHCSLRSCWRGFFFNCIR